MNMTKQFFEVSAGQSGMRLDQFLAQQFPEQTRSFFQKQIRDGNVSINEQSGHLKAGSILREKDRVSIAFAEPKSLEALPENIPLDILYEDEDLLVINKPKGMVVHPAHGHDSGTLVNALLWHCRDDLSGINGVLRPGIVHRIDQDTTGSLIICKNDRSHNFIAEQLAAHSITRVYEAIVTGNLKEDTGSVDAPIGRHPTDRKKMAVNSRSGKRAVTHYRVLHRFAGPAGVFTHIECRLETGRTQFAFTWQVSDIRFSGMKYTEKGQRASWAFRFRDRSFMQGPSALYIRRQRNIWNLRLRCRDTLCSCCKSLDNSINMW